MNKLSLINEVLADSRLGQATGLDDNLFNVYPYNNMEHLIDETVNVISNSQAWEWCEEVTSLEYFSSFENYYLSDFDIDKNRVTQIYYFDGIEKQVVFRVPNAYFKERYQGLTTTGKPQVFAIEKDKLKFYPKLDADYGLKIVNSKQHPPLIGEDETIQYFPTKEQDLFNDYITAVMSAILDKNNTTDLYLQALRSISKTRYASQNALNRKTIVPSKVRW